MTQQAAQFDVKTIKAGDRYLVRKGTVIRTTAKERQVVAGKDHYVKVHHAYPAFYTTAAALLYGRTYAHMQSPELEAEWKALEASDRVAFHRNANILVYPAKIVWAGAGGYWREVEFQEENLVK